MSEPTTIYILSDSIGETAEQVARAAASQFVGETFRFRRFPYVNTPQQIDHIVAQAHPHNTLIMYTLVIEDLRVHLRSRATEYKVRAIDVLDSTIRELAELLHHKPDSMPGVQRQLDSHYFDKISAIEFAVNYDDGKLTRGIEQADLVLLGVSRTSKTPLSMYLALKYYKVANFPLVPEIIIPEILFKMPKEKIIGLTSDPSKLNQIRIERLKMLGLRKESDYANVTVISRELEFARRVMQRIGCKVIDVTHRAIEETASLILQHLEEVSGFCKLDDRP
ncbi:MAG: pyruvate, water dikinase regulatory protein [bacterium]